MRTHKLLLSRFFLLIALIVTAWPAACLAELLPFRNLPAGNATDGHSAIGVAVEASLTKSLPNGTNCTPAPADLVSWWRAERSAIDAMGFNSGVVSNGVTFVPGVTGESFVFDGVDDWVFVSNSPSLNMGAGQDFSIEGWIKPEPAITPFGIQSIVDKRFSPNSVAATGYALHLENGNLGCQLGAGGTSYATFQTSSRNLRDGQWHHVALAVVRNATNGGKLFVDGQPVLVFDPTSQKGDLSTSEPFRIGKHADPALKCFFKGLIDELGVYRHALSEAEVARIYAAGTAGKCDVAACAAPAPGLTSWWPAENDASDIVDGNSGTVGPGVTFVTGKVGQAFSFNTSGARVMLPNAANLQLQSFTLEAWIKRTSPTKATWDSFNHGMIIAGQWGSYAFGLLDDGHLFLSQIGVSSVSTTNRVVDTSEFHHVAVTKNGSEVVLFIDGVAETMPPYNPTPSLTSPLAIGTRATDYVVTFRGFIDEPSIYARALSSQEILGIVTAGSFGKCRTPVAPSILSQPASQSVLLGGGASFSVGAIGSQPLYYQWRHQGNDLAGRSESLLVLTNAQLADAGEYSVRVWNSAGAAISSNALLTVQATPTNCAPTAPGLVSWWPGEGDATDVIDGNSGAVGSGVTFVQGKVRQAFSFNTSGARVTLPNAANLQLQDFTLEAWVKRTSLTKATWDVYDHGLIIAGPWGSYGMGLLDNGRLFLSCLGVSSVSTTNRVADTNEFHHVAVTKNGATVVLYIDGIAETMPPYNPTFTFNGPLAIGTRGTDFAVTFRGCIDEPSVYARALTAQEILAVVGAGAGGKCRVVPTPPEIVTQPQSTTVTAGQDAIFSVTAQGPGTLTYQWRFYGTNIPSATGASLLLENIQPSQAGIYSVRVANDYGSVLSSNAVLTVNLSETNCVPAPLGLVSWWPAEGSGLDAIGPNSGVVTNGVAFVPGVVGLAFAFDGVDDWVLVSNSPSLNIGAGQDFSIEAWIKPQTAVTPFGIQSIVDKRFSPNSVTAAGYALHLGNGRLGCQIGAAGSGYATFNSSAPDLRDNKWHHIALSLVRGATNGGKLYVDGLVVQEFNPASQQGDLSTSEPFRIGRHADPRLNASFKGLIDELSVYRRALSGTEIAAIHAAGSAGKCITGTAPVIVTQPTSRTVLAGLPATFTVVAEGAAPLLYQWKFNGNSIAGATDSAFTIAHVLPSHAGAYSVVVANTLGAVTSSNAILAVNQAPVAMCKDVIVPVGSNCLAMASIDNGSFDPDGDPVTTQQFPPGPYFPGSNVVHLLVTDSHGNSNLCAAVVTVLDTLPPSIVCPPNVVVTNGHATWMSAVDFTVTASDNCSGLTVTADPPSGSQFPVGVTTVQCRAVDAAGNVATCSFSVTVVTGNHAPTPIIEVSPLATFAGWTNLMVIAPDNTNANVTFDGSKSYDVDDTNFLYFWFEGTNLLGITTVTTNKLAVGTHEVMLLVDDTLPYGTNSATSTVEVITPAQAIAILFSMLDDSNLSSRSRRPLEATLGAANAAFESNRFIPGVTQLAAFQNKVRAQVTPFDPVLAEQLIIAAQSIIDAIGK